MLKEHLNIAVTPATNTGNIVAQTFRVMDFRKLHVNRHAKTLLLNNDIYKIRIELICNIELLEFSFYTSADILNGKRSIFIRIIINSTL